MKSEQEKQTDGFDGEGLVVKSLKANGDSINTKSEKVITANIGNLPKKRIVDKANKSSHTNNSFQKLLFENENIPFPQPKDTKFKFIDLFAGIGGFRLAMQSFGGKCVFTSEWDKHAQKTYNANFGEVPFGDITKEETKRYIPDNFDVLCAGFPCQAFSIAGKRGGFEDTRGTLFFDVAEIIRRKQPKAVFLENVRGLVTHDGGKTLQVIVSTLEELGYKVFYDVLNAKDFGVPQDRKRIYIVGFRLEEFGGDINFSFPSRDSLPVPISKFLEENAVGYSISKHLQKVYIFKKDDGKPQLVDKNSDVQVKTLVSTYHKIQRLTSTFVKDGETGLRLFTVNECKAIMGFDKKFIVPVSRTQMYRQFGNSVAVPVVKAIAKNILKVILKSSK